jgi:hypothetical protein
VLADEKETWDKATFTLESLTLYQLLLLTKDDLVCPLLMFLIGDWIREPKRVVESQMAWLAPLRKAVEG